MNKVYTAVALALVVSLPATAEVIKRSDGYTANCDNATQREDGTPLAASEIKNVWYYLDKTWGNLTTPDLSVLMSGGCKSTLIDTKPLAVGTYHKYAVTIDTDDQSSEVSPQLADPLVIQNAKPKAPGNIR